MSSAPQAPASAVVDCLADWLRADAPPPWIVETSGSTGQPKRVLLPRAAVLASVRASADRLGASGAWVLALPAGFVAGVQVICRSLVAGHRPVLRDDHPSLAAAVAALPDGVPGFVSLVPTQLLRVLDAAESDGADGSAAADLAALASLHTVLLGGGPVDPGLRERAAAHGVRTVATYGSAETAGGCVYDGVPLDGVALAVGADGRLRIGGPTVFAGYQDDPALTAETLVDGWFLTSDAGRLDHDGRLEVLGRLDDLVVTGGVNVPAGVVAARLRAHPDVVAAEALGLPDPEWGNRLVAVVVGALDLEAARAWVAQAHPRSWAPRQLVVLERLDDLPLLANGKPDRAALRALALAAAPEVGR
ncbi:AMP-binding protein [Nocardioides sp. TRM66260-LWL]|uniref:AMP-binding protein n=1 Tax=Nocardioides sp. TRM66260-LWL TaxID=2874478 RepID=UPI001CC37353|nr:AMP-binding protein [Nocardioides sp. TRM66260-LWL]MBZ5734808.1 AMP-binding protein [Nocardioides sp. TRM66260-LWL]